MAQAMKPGSIIVDLAAEQGGNVELTRPGEAIEIGGVTILGFHNVPGRLPADASSLLARNIYNLISAFWDNEKHEFVVDWDDDIFKGIALTRDGKAIHPDFEATPAEDAESAPDEPTPDETTNDEPTPSGSQ